MIEIEHYLILILTGIVFIQMSMINDLRKERDREENKKGTR